jgi:hypothetical protein
LYKVFERCWQRSTNFFCFCPVFFFLHLFQPRCTHTCPSRHTNSESSKWQFSCQILWDDTKAVLFLAPVWVPSFAWSHDQENFVGRPPHLFLFNLKLCRTRTVWKFTELQPATYFFCFSASFLWTYLEMQTQVLNLDVAQTSQPEVDIPNGKLILKKR